MERRVCYGFSGCELIHSPVTLGSIAVGKATVYHVCISCLIKFLFTSPHFLTLHCRNLDWKMKPWGICLGCQRASCVFPCRVLLHHVCQRSTLSWKFAYVLVTILCLLRHPSAVQRQLNPGRQGLRPIRVWQKKQYFRSQANSARTCLYHWVPTALFRIRCVVHQSR